MNLKSTSKKTTGTPSKGGPTKRLPKASGRTLQEIISQFQRPDGGRGLRVRELTKATHVAAETLKVARVEPERFSLASLFGLAELLGTSPAQLLADVFHQVSQRDELGLLKLGRQRQPHKPAASDAAARDIG